MIILQSLRLSFPIFWRFVLVLPFLLGFYAVLLAVAVFLAFASLGLGVFSLPFLLISSLATAAIGFVMTIHPYLIGTRFGLSKLGITPKSEQNHLVIMSAILGLVLSLLTAAVLYLVFAVISLFLYQDFSAISNFEVPEDPISEISWQLATGTFLPLEAIFALVALCIRALVLPIFAEVAAGRSPMGGGPHPIAGFGRFFPSLLVILLFATLAATLPRPFFVGNSYFLGSTNNLLFQILGLFADIRDGDFSSFNFANAAVVVGVILMSVWLFAIQCACAALTFQRRAEHADLAKSEIFEEQQDLGQEVGAMWRDRMNNK